MEVTQEGSVQQLSAVDAREQAMLAVVEIIGSSIGKTSSGTSPNVSFPRSYQQHRARAALRISVDDSFSAGED